MEFTTSDITAITDYFTDFVAALTALLRLGQQPLPPYWCGIDKAKFSAILYFTQDGLVVRILGKWLGAPIKCRFDATFAEATAARWKAHRVGFDKHSFASVVGKHLAGNPVMGLHVNGDSVLQLLPKEAGGAFLAVAPILYMGLSAKQVAHLPTLIDDKQRDAAGLAAPRPPWLISLISQRSGIQALDGLDKDPFIAAKGVADIIWKIAGLTDEDPKERYQQVRDELLNAVQTVNESNEKAIHKVIEKSPWILVDEVDYSDVEAERSLCYRERLPSNNDSGVESHGKEVRPDFLYHRYDDTVLIVEIEAASKRLMIKRSETSYQLPSAQAVAAHYQISNYKYVCSGPFGSQIKEDLGKTDLCSFDYLLVIGSDKQPDFDRRSWSVLREEMRYQGIALRDWDYYLDRLARFADAASFNLP
jgi:hypothetical protein